MQWTTNTRRHSGAMRSIEPGMPEEVLSPRHAHVFQHEARPARLANPVAEIIRGGPRVGADPHLVEGARAAAAHDRREQARILVADHGAEPLHGAGVHRERLVAAEAGG